MRNPRLCILTSIFLTAITPTIPRAEHPRAAEDLKWDISTAPFDVKQVLRIPPADRNGEKLANDALAEFDVGMVERLPKALRPRRKALVDFRNKEYGKLWPRLDVSPRKIPNAEIDALLDLYEEGFKKLAAAQRFPEIVFVNEIGLTASPPLSQLSASRQVARIAEIRCVRLLERGKIDAAIDNLNLLLKVCSALQPRGGISSQCTAYAIVEFCEAMVSRILAARQLTPAHCKRLASLLDTHLRTAEKCFLTGAQMDYIEARTFLDDFENRRGDFAPFHGKAGQAKLAADFVSAFDDKAAAKRVVSMKADGFRREVKLLDDAWRNVISSLDSPYESRREQLITICKQFQSQSAFQGLFMPGPVFSDFALAHDKTLAQLNGLIALTAARHWQLASEQPMPFDAKRVSLAAGLKAVPADPFRDGEPIRLKLQKGKPVAYSVGADGIDDDAKTDRGLGRRGDIIFRIAKDVHLKPIK